MLVWMGVIAAHAQCKDVKHYWLGRLVCVLSTWLAHKETRFLCIYLMGCWGIHHIYRLMMKNLLPYHWTEKNWICSPIQQLSLQSVISWFVSSRKSLSLRGISKAYSLTIYHMSSLHKLSIFIATINNNQKYAVIRQFFGFAGASDSQFVGLLSIFPKDNMHNYIAIVKSFGHDNRGFATALMCTHVSRKSAGV